jgi:hypothetical protein
MRQLIKAVAGVAALLVLSAGGCDRTEQKLQQAEKSLDSWDATLALVQRQWADERVPSKYVRQLADAAATSLEDSRQTVNDASKADRSRRDGLVGRLIDLRDRAQQLRDAADAGRRPS